MRSGATGQSCRRAARPEPTAGAHVVNRSIHGQSRWVWGRISCGDRWEGHHDGKNRDADPGAWPGRLWDVALSFAGPQRNYLEQIAEALKQRGAPRRSCSLAGLCETPGRPGSDDTLAAFMAWFLLGLVPSFAGWCVLRRRIVQDTCLPGQHLRELRIAAPFVLGACRGRNMELLVQREAIEIDQGR